MNAALSILKNSALVFFSVALRWDEKKGKKEIRFPMNEWNSINDTNYLNYIDESKNGVVIRTGRANSIVVIDADEEKAKAEGCPIPAEILKLLEETASPIVKTPNGRHFYYTYDETDHEMKSGTTIHWNGKRIPHLDIRGDGGIIIAPPSQYQRGDTICRYECIEGDFEDGFAPLPKQVLSALKAAPEEPLQSYVESGSEEVAEDLLKALNPKRWDNRDDWLRIGIILFNERLPCALWDQYSRVSAKHYTADGCSKAWRSFHTGTLTIRSLWKMVKDDNPTEYKRLQYKHINIKVYLTTPTHLSLSQLFHALRPDDFVFAHENGWYERQQNNTWRCRSTEPASLMTLIPGVLVPLCWEFCARSREAAMAATDAKDKEIHVKEHKEILKTMYQLQNAGFLKSMCQMLRSLYASDTFCDMLDTKPHLFAFENGVYDLDAGVFRDIQPDDYISFTCGYSYSPRRDATVRADILKFIDSLFENAEMSEYFLNKLAYTLHGRKRFQEFDMWKGKGSNGKSKMIAFLQSCFGAYLQNLPIAYFTQEASQGKSVPLPELVKCRGARLVWTSEPEADAMLQTGLIKQLSGEEKIRARAMRENGIEFMPQFGVFMLVNTFPRIPRSTEFYALQRRLRVTPFPFQFMDAPVCENHRPINLEYGKLLAQPEWRDEFINMLIERYVNVVAKLQTLKPPKPVEDETAEFFSDNNPLAAWLPKRFITNADPSSRVKASEISKLFSEDNPNIKLDSKRIGSLLSALGFHSKKSHGIMVYVGFQKREDEPLIVDDTGSEAA